MNNSNATTSNVTAPPTFDYLFSTLSTIDNVIKSIGMLVVPFYILVLICSPSLQKRTFLFLNHAVIVNQFYLTMMFSYQFANHPSFPDATLNNVLCSISELVWIFASYIRAYSMLLLAIYRYLATFHINAFKRINDSLLSLVGLIALCWAVAILLPLASKYIFSTTSSAIYCLDGNSPYLLNTILYIVYTYVFVIILPVPAVIVIYVKIMRKLNVLSKSVATAAGNGTGHRTGSLAINEAGSFSRLPGGPGANDKISTTGNTESTVAVVTNAHTSTTTASASPKSYEKQKTFAYQFILMCVSLVASSFVLVIFQTRNAPGYLATFYYARPMLRSYMVVAISLVPFTCLYYHPSKPAFVRRVRKFFASTKVSPRAVA